MTVSPKGKPRMLLTRTLSVVLLLLTLTACGPIPLDGATSASAQAAPTPTAYPTAQAAARPTYTVQRGTVETTLEFSGRWLPRDQTRLSFEVSGKIRSVNVRAGDTVRAGDVLADYQIEDLEDQLASALLNLETARLNLENSTGGGADQITEAAYALASANLDLESTRANSPWTSLDNARRSIETAERNLDNARRSYQELQGRPDSSASAVDNARQSVASAEDQLASAWNSYYSAAQSFNNHQYSIARAENSLQRAQATYDEALAGTSVEPGLIQSVRSAEMNVEQIRRDIARSTLVAPVDGVVLEVTIQPGSSVEAYTAVITIATPDPKEVVVQLAYNDAQRLNVGMSGRCTPLNRPDLVVECVVRRIPLSSRDVDQTTRIAAVFYDDEAALSALINVEMALEVRENTLWLPPAALRTFQNRTFVVVDAPEGQRVVDVTIGLQTDERVEILTGLEEGDVVIAP